MARNMRNTVHICGPGEVGPQCGYVSYMAGSEYGPKGVPMHTHRKADGSWLETAWGPAEKCRVTPEEKPQQ